MGQFAYLFLSLYFLSIWFFIFLYRKDLRRRMLKASIIGGFAGIIAEFWYFRDYWKPNTLLGEGVISIEDFVIGFAIVGVTLTIYDVLFKKRNIRKFPKRKSLFLFFFGLGTLSLFIFSNWLKINSVIVSEIAFFVFTIAMVGIRKDLMKPAFISGVLSVALALPIYAFLFSWLFPGYWENYWLLFDTRLGIELINGVPLTEILWYFSWGALAGSAYNFLSGEGKLQLNSEEL